MRKPDRAQFEENLALLNNRIISCCDQLISLIGSQSLDLKANDDTSGQPMEGLLTFHRNAIKRLKFERGIIYTDLRALKKRIDEQKAILKACKEDLAKLESEDLLYRNPQKIAIHLGRLEKQYNSMQTRNARDEHALVVQIDKLKRNQKQLVKWKSLITERDEMASFVSKLVHEMHEKYRRLNVIRIDLPSHKKKLDEFRSQQHSLSEDLINLQKQRFEMIRRYDQECVEYKEFIHHKNKTKMTDRKSIGRTPSTRSACTTVKSRGNSNDDCNSSDSDSNDYEPFCKEKRLCRTLASYVQSFLNERPIAAAEDENNNEACFVEDNCIDSDGFVLPKACKKKHVCRKDKRRMTQSLPHAPNVFNDFDSIGLKAPVNYGEIAIVLQKLEERHKYYENQTLLPLSFSCSFDENSYATSESGLTIDTDSFVISGLSLSDVDSFSIKNFSQNSLMNANAKRHSSYFNVSFDEETKEDVETNHDDVFHRSSLQKRQVHAVNGSGLEFKRCSSWDINMDRCQSSTREPRAWSMDHLVVYSTNTLNDEGFCSKNSTS